MTKPKLTIGIPHCCDYKRLWHTLAALIKTRIDLGVVEEVELLVVDNSKTVPDAAKGAKHAAETWKRIKELPNARYVEFTEASGTAPTKNQVVRGANGRFVVCLDSHCELANDVMARLLAWIDAHPLDDDIHFAMELHLRMVNHPDGTPAVVCSHRDEKFGGDGNFGVCAVSPAALLPDAPPFQTGTAICAFFMVRKASWLGFHPACKGWGGEEHYIAEKYRQAGRKAWVHPDFQFAHQYGDVDGSPYIGKDWVTKCRNVLHGYMELGYPDLMETKAAHVQPDRMSEKQWAELVREMGVIMRGRGKEPLRLTPRPRPANVVELKTTNALQPGEAELLKDLPCPLRLRRSGNALCNVGCAASQQKPVSLFDCLSFGLVTLNGKRKDLKNCQGCTSRPGTKPPAEPITLPDTEGLPSRRLAVGVLSAARYEHKRQAIRETWAKDLPDDVEVLFLIGDPALAAPELRGDELWLPCPDDYQHLTLKTRGWCQWLQAHRAFGRAFKCDDDTYLAVDRFLAQDKADADFVGSPLHHDRRVPSGGAGYLLSPKAVAILARDMVGESSAEDVEAFSALRAHGIHLTPTKRLSAGHQVVPAPGNEQISAHYITPENMRDIHAAIHPAPVVASNN